MADVAEMQDVYGAVTVDRLDRIESLLQRIAEALEEQNAREVYDSSLVRWRAGEARHPDD